MHLDKSNIAFETTQWTLLDALHSDDQDAQDAALNTLVMRYWPAVYSALRSRGQRREQAEEITQAFFTEVVLSRRLFHKGDRDRGSLRALIRTALKRFVIDQHRKSHAHNGLSLSERDLQREDQFVSNNADVDFETAFDRRWAASILEEALARCERYLLECDRRRHWDAFAMRSVTPTLHGNCRPDLTAVAKEVGFDTPTEVASALKVVRKRIEICLMEVIAETAADPEEGKAEFNDLKALLS